MLSDMAEGSGHTYPEEYDSNEDDEYSENGSGSGEGKHSTDLPPSQLLQHTSLHPSRSRPAGSRRGDHRRGAEQLYAVGQPEPRVPNLRCELVPGAGHVCGTFAGGRHQQALSCFRYRRVSCLKLQQTPSSFRNNPPAAARTPLEKPRARKSKPPVEL